MKNTIALISAISAALMLSACASNTSAPTTAAAAPAAGTMFCTKDRLYTASNDLVCNWSKSAAEVCRDNVQVTRIAQSAVTGEPVNASRCASGLWMVQVTMK